MKSEQELAHVYIRDYQLLLLFLGVSLQFEVTDRPLDTIAVFLGSNNGSEGGVMSKGWQVSAMLSNHVVMNGLEAKLVKAVIIDLRTNKRIMSPVDDLFDRRLEPVERCGEGRAIGEGPVERVVEELNVRVDGRVGEERFGDEHRERAIAGGSVQAGLGHGGAFGACDL